MARVSLLRERHNPSVFAIILAGGRGTRLAHLADQRAKPAVPFGASFRLIDFPLSNCLNSGIRNIAVATQYRAHDLIRHLQTAWSFLPNRTGECIEIWPAQQQTPDACWYRGTADALFQNIRLIKEHRPDYIIVLAGDHIYKQDYRILLSEHISRRADVTISCIEVPRGDAHAFGVVEIDEDNRIIDFIEKPKNLALTEQTSTVLVSMGIYAFKADFLINLLESSFQAKPSGFDFGHDILPELIGKVDLYAHHFSKSCRISTNRTTPYWRDVGTLDAYWAAHMDLTQIDTPIDLADPNWPIYGYTDNLLPVQLTCDIQHRQGMALESILGAGVIISGGRVRRSVLGENTKVGSSSTVDESILLPNAQVGSGAALYRVIVTDNCQIPDGLRIGSDAGFDSRYFHRLSSGLTVVTQPMIDALPENQYRNMAPTKIDLPPLMPLRRSTVVPMRLATISSPSSAAQTRIRAQKQPSSDVIKD